MEVVTNGNNVTRCCQMWPHYDFISTWGRTLYIYLCLVIYTQSGNIQQDVVECCPGDNLQTHATKFMHIFLLETHVSLISQQFITLLSTRLTKFFEFFSQFSVFLNNMSHLTDSRLESQSTSRMGATSR